MDPENLPVSTACLQAGLHLCKEVGVSWCMRGPFVSERVGDAGMRSVCGCEAECSTCARVLEWGLVRGGRRVVGCAGLTLHVHLCA